MARYENTLWCDGCGVEITWSPFVADHRDYCCRDCSQGQACDCGEQIIAPDFGQPQSAHELTMAPSKVPLGYQKCQ